MNDVVISFVSMIESDGDEPQRYELTTIGKMRVDNGVFRISYVDSGSESGAESGEANKTFLTVDTNDDTIVIRRKGEIDSKLNIHKGRRCIGHYNVGPASLLIGVSERMLDVDLNSDGGSLHVEYAIDINAEFVSKNTIDIKIKKA